MSGFFARYPFDGVPPSTVLTIGTIDSVAPSANGAVISGHQLVFQSASATVPGLVSTASQTMAGAKTFSTSIASPLVLFNGSTSGALTMRASAATTSYTLTWPSGQGGVSTFLKNDGSGGLSWAAGTGGSGVDSIGTIDSQSKSADGLVIIGTTLYGQTADGSFPGFVSTGTQTLAGAKTFSTSVKSPIFISNTANPASAGALRLANTDLIDWRNQANNGNLALGVSASDVLQFNGVDLQNSISVSDTSTIDLTFSSNTLSADIIAGSITNSLINASAAIVYSKLNLTGTIVNADLSASAAIANAKLADMAQSTIKGRAAGGGTGAPQDLTATQATAILNNMVGDSGSGGTKGLVPAPASGDAASGKFLKADGTWAVPAGAGDVVGPGSATDNGFVRFDGTTGKLIKNSAATISNADVNASAAIAFSKLASLPSAHILVGSAGNVATDVAVTGDISLTNAGVTAYAGTVPVLKGGTGQTSYTDGQLLIGNSSGNTLTKTTLTAGSNISITNGGGSITIASSGAAPSWSYVAQSTTLNPAALGTYYLLSGASFTITLPTAASVTGQGFYFRHNGTSLSQVYTFNTTSAQTIGGVASGSYALYTTGETLYLVSDGSNWQIAEHDTTTSEADAGVPILSSSSHYSFTIGSASITLGTTYTANGNTFIVSTTSVASTTLLCYGTGSPGASGTLTYVSGPTAGNRAFSAVSTAGAPARGTALFENFMWWRQGQRVFFNWSAKWAAGTQGTGDYGIFFQTGLLPDTTNMTANLTVVGASYTGAAVSATGFGSGWKIASASSPLTPYLANAQLFKIVSSGLGVWAGGVTDNLSAIQTFHLEGNYRVTGWQP